MVKRLFRFLSHQISSFFLFLFVGQSAVLLAGPTLPTPSEYLGFEVGADRKVAKYGQIVSYFHALAALSRQIEVENLGKSTLGNDLIQVVISSQENLKEKEKYKEIARKLADPRSLTEAGMNQFTQQGKVILLISGNIHSTEIGATQMFMEWAHALLASPDPKIKKWLEDVILLLIPSLNPDGQIMEVAWYQKHLGTPFEGGEMPWLYHPYAGHDNNRDWYMLTQQESKIVTRDVYFDWCPQVWLDQHQMGSTGARMFVPPYTNPVADKVPPVLWRVLDHIGTAMSWKLEEQRKSGVGYGYAFDAYFPGCTESTTWWKNIFGLLTEVASARFVSPLDIAPGELSGNGKGLVDYKVQVNFPNPWPGGIWRLRDIMDYERIASDALLDFCSHYRAEILRNKLQMARDAIHSAPEGEFYTIPIDQRDPPTAARLAHLLHENGVEVHFHPAEKTFYIGKSQPMYKFILEMLEPQRYPKVRPAPAANILAPYDVTTWSLPLMMGVKVRNRLLAAQQQSQLRLLRDEDWPVGEAVGIHPAVYAISHETNQATRLINELLKGQIPFSLARAAFQSGSQRFAAGTLLVEPDPRLDSMAREFRVKAFGLTEKPKVAADSLKEVRIGLYKPWLASLDEGWTRWILEQYHFNIQNLDNKNVKDGNLARNYDAILLPHVAKEIILEGKPKREEGEMRYFPEFPPEFSGGIGKEGAAHLKKFVEEGGTLVALGASCDFITETFNVPVSNPLAKLKSPDFNCPGTLLRAYVNPGHPVTYGMPEETAAFLAEARAFETDVPGLEFTRKVLVSYPAQAEDILLSGWIQGAEKLERKAAAVALTSGKGKIVLFGFRVQFRAQTEGTFKLLFNALHWAGM
jgi:hypothetical protein